MKRFQLIMLALFFSGLASQSLLGQSFWARSYGSISDFVEVHPTPDGGYIGLGETTSLGSVDMAVVKVSGTGAVEWFRSFGNGSYNEQQAAIKPMPGGGYIVGGTGQGNFTSVNSKAALMVRLDDMGNVIWQRVEANALVRLYDFLPLADGSVIAVGDRYDDGAVMRLDSNGNVLWTKVIDAGAETNFKGVLGLSPSTFIVHGSKSPNIALDNYALRMDINGNVLNQKSISAGSEIQDMIQLSDGNLLNAINSGSLMYLFKTDTNFNVIWGRRIEFYIVHCGGIAELPNGEILMSAWNQSGNGTQKFTGLLKFNSFGNLVQRKRINAASNRQSGRIVINTNDTGAIYAVHNRILKVHPDLNQNCGMANYLTGSSVSYSSSVGNVAASISNGTLTLGTNVSFATTLSTSSSQYCNTLICNLSASAAVSSNYNGADISCATSSNGSALASGTGGSGYTYLWDANAGGQTTAAATGLAAGTYSVTVTDAGGCTDVASVTLTAPQAMQVGNSVVDATCDQNNGSATAVPNGGTGAYSYQWAPNAGSQTTATALNLPGGSYSVTVTDGNGCTSETVATVATTSAPVAEAGNDTAICEGATAQLTGTGGGTYNWNQGLGGGNSHAVSPTSTTVYELTVTAGNGCTDVDSVTVTVNPLPNANAGANQSLCIGASANLSASGGGGYQWNQGLGAGANQTVNPTATTTYTVTVTDVNGCSQSDDVTVTVNALPTANAGPDQTICAGDAANLNASGGTGYQWNQGLGAGAAQTVSPNATTTYAVTVTDANGCSDTDDLTVMVNVLPNANAGANQTICAGNAVNLSASGGTSYQWDQGLGAGANQTVSPTATTTYTVTVTDVNGCSQNDAVTVTVNALPNANAGANQSICIGASASLNASGGNSYQWNQGLGAGPNQTVNPSSTTTYTVTVTDVNGCSQSDDVTVTVNALPTANAGPDQTICAGDAANLNASGGASYQWNQGLGAGAAQTVSPNATTSYAVTVTDANGCSDTDDLTVTVNALPNANAGSNQTVCAGNAVNLSASGGTSYQWDQGLGAGANQTVNPTATTTYTVTVTDVNGCSQNDAVTVTVNALPNASAGANQAICIGASASLNASGGTSYQWDQGLGAGANQTVNPSSTTTYTVTVTDVNGCSQSDDVTVTVNALPNANAGADLALCMGDSTVLNATGGQSYLWDNGLGAGQSHNISPLSTTSYSVTVTDGNGCMASDQVTITVNALPTATASADTSICEGSSTNISATGGGLYLWDNGLGNGPSHSVSPTSSTTYTVTVTDGNGCMDSDGVTITVFPMPTASISGDTAICEGDSTLLIGSGGLSFLWSTGETSPSITVSPNGFTIYTLDVTDANGCGAATTHSLAVDPLPPVPSITQLGSDLIATTANSYQWTINGVPIPNATNQTYTPTQSGFYAVTVTNAAGCSATSQSLEFIYVGIEAALPALQIELYPNPATDWLRLQASGLEEGSGGIQLYDLKGKLLREWPVEVMRGSLDEELDVSGLAAGNYMLRVQIENALAVKKLLIGQSSR